MSVQPNDRVRLPGEPQSVIVRMVEQVHDGVSIIYKREDGTLGEVSLDIDSFDQLLPIRYTGNGNPKMALAGLWGYWVMGVIANIRQATLATTPLRAYAHQDEAVYGSMLPQPTLRFLLADEPGTGKTIMCGMYITEMMRQGRLTRALLVVPAHLLTKWERDLDRFFGIDAELITAEVGRSSAPLRPDRHFWLVSLDLLARNPQVRQKVALDAEAAWDLVVFDEGHRLTPTAQAAFPVAQALAVRATHLLVLTATPHRGSEYLFRALLHLLDPDLYPWSHDDQALLGTGASRLKPARTHFIRRMKEQLRDHDNITPLFPERHARNISVHLSATEQELYEDVLVYCDAYMDDTAGLARSVYGKRAASSLYAISETLRRRADRLRSGEAANAYKLTPTLTAKDLLDEGDEEREDLEERAIAVRSKDSGGELSANGDLRTRIAVLLADRSFVSAKWIPLAQDIMPQHGIAPQRTEQLLIFTEYADSAAWLEQVFRKAGYTVRRYAGDVPRDERECIQADFLDRKFQVLISTDAGNEGIDLQSAHVLVNWDIPWSIVRMEQRAGRLHRIGQVSRVDIYNLISTTTREGRVQEVILGNIVAAADALDGKIFDVLGSVLEQLGVDYGKLMLRASAGGSNTEAAIRQARTVTAEQYTRATGQQQEIEQQLATQPDPNTFLSHLAKDRLDAINPAVVAAFMRILSEARRWGMSDWLREYLYRLQAPPGTSLPSALGGKNRAVIAASVDSLIEARREGADLAQAIVLGPAEPAYRTLVEAILRDSADHLASGAVLDDPSALTPYELFVFDSAILKRQGSRILRSAHPILVRVDRSGSRTVAWQSVSHLMAVQAAQEASSASVSIPSFRAGPQTDAEMEAELEIARLAERARAELHVWVDRVSAQLDRLQDEVMEPYQDLPFEERRTRWESLTKAVSERKRKIQEAAELTVQPPRLVGRVYVRVGASSDRVENPPLSGVSNILSGSLDDRERMLVDTEMRAMRVCKKALEDEGFVVDDVHQSRCGYDLHARRAYEQRLVEVKGLQGDLSQGVTMESSEWLMAQQHRDDYWVYVVVQCTGEPQLFGAYRNPVALFGEDKKLIRRFHIGAATLRKVHTV